MGSGSYSVMPMSSKIVLGWGIVDVIEAVSAGLITGMIMKKQG